MIILMLLCSNENKFDQKKQNTKALLTETAVEDFKSISHIEIVANIDKCFEGNKAVLYQI